MQKTTVLIIDDQIGNNFKERLVRSGEYTVVGNTDNCDIGFAMAERYEPQVIILNIDMPHNRGVSLAEALSLELPMSSLILVTMAESKKVLHTALQVGAKDVLNLPVDDDRLFRAVQRAAEQGRMRQKVFSVQKKKSTPQFKTVTVFSTKGGVGKTTLSLNLAMAIRQLTGKRVALVDLDLMSGNLGLMAGVTWKRSIKDLVDDINNVDKEMIDGYCTEHPSGVKILSAPVQPDFSGFIQPDHIQKILSLMSEVFNYVIVDGPTYLHDTVIPALEESSDIIAVTTLDLPSIQNMKQCLDLLGRLSMRSKVRVVVNRVGYMGGLKVRDVEDELGMDVQCVIPDQEKIALDAANMGKPIFLAARSSQISKRIEELANKLIVADDRRSKASEELSGAEMEAE
jgi:pilus assembly protein CpaE